MSIRYFLCTKKFEMYTYILIYIHFLNPTLNKVTFFLKDSLDTYIYNF